MYKQSPLGRPTYTMQLRRKQRKSPSIDYMDSLFSFSIDVYVLTV